LLEPPTPADRTDLGLGAERGYFFPPESGTGHGALLVLLGESDRCGPDVEVARKPLVLNMGNKLLTFEYALLKLKMCLEVSNNITYISTG